MQVDFGGVEWIFPSEVQAAILNLENSGELGRGEKFTKPVGGRKKNWGGGRGRGKHACTDMLVSVIRSGFQDTQDRRRFEAKMIFKHKTLHPGGLNTDFTFL